MDLFNVTAPAIGVLKNAFERGTLAHIAVDWQYRYYPKKREMSAALIEEEQIIFAAFDRAVDFTRAVHPQIPTISLGYKHTDANNLFLTRAREYGPVFWKQCISGFECAGFKKFMDASSYDTLIISGLYVHDCQGATVFDALQEGYKVLVPTDMVVGELIVGHRNLSMETEPAGEAVDEDVRRFYFRYDDDAPDASEEGNLFGIKSYEITRALGL